MRVLLLFVLIALSSCNCGPRDDCHPDGTGVWTIDTNVGCDMIRGEVDIALQVLEDTGVLHGGDARNSFRGVAIHTFDSDTVKSENPFDDGKEEYSGYYWSVPTRHISLDRTRIVLVHELLHDWDAQHLSVGTSWHEGWDSNGYDSAQTEYVRRLLPFWQQSGYDLSDDQHVPW